MVCDVLDLHANQVQVRNTRVGGGYGDKTICSPCPAAAAVAFSRANKWTKHGIALIPFKYGSGYNATFLDQAGALLEVYSGDGSILVRQCAVEIGQDSHTFIAQVAARAADPDSNCRLR